MLDALRAGGYDGWILVEHDVLPTSPEKFRQADRRPGPQSAVPQGARLVKYDVLTMGRVGVDLYPLQAGLSLADVTTFGKFLGGSATNVAVAAARHGRRSAVITRTGDDPFGRFVHAALVELGVDDAFVSSVPGLPTPVTFCEIFPPDNFPLWFYRFPKAPDLEIRPDELDLAACRDASDVLGDGDRALAAAEPGRAPRRLAGAGRRPLTVLDLDYRPMFWAVAGERRGSRSPRRCRT